MSKTTLYISQPEAKRNLTVAGEMIKRQKILSKSISVPQILFLLVYFDRI